MKQTLKFIYDTYFDNMHLVKNPLPKNPKAYNPHAGFKLTQYFAHPAEKDFENIFPAMIAEEDFAGLQSLVDKMYNSVNGFKLIHKSAKSYCKSFLEFLNLIIAKPNRYKKIIKNMQDAYHIDGIESLIDTLGGDDALIRKAIAESYFFDPQLVSKRFVEIVNDFNKRNPLPARWSYGGTYNPSVSTKKQARHTPNLMYNNIPVTIDKDGNAQVRLQIRCYTGYSVSAGANSIFQNYKISHIWGNAYDPRYFTNLWNIVLVPAWANDLLDKPNAKPSSIESKMSNTYMSICRGFYKMNGFSWSSINMSVPNNNTQKDVVKGDFVFNVIGQSANKKLGHISKKRIKL